MSRTYTHLAMICVRRWCASPMVVDSDCAEIYGSVIRFLTQLASDPSPQRASGCAEPVELSREYVPNTDTVGWMLTLMQRIFLLAEMVLTLPIHTFRFTRYCESTTCRFQNGISASACGRPIISLSVGACMTHYRGQHRVYSHGSTCSRPRTWSLVSILSYAGARVCPTGVRR